MNCKKSCFKFFSFLLVALLLMFMLTACKRNSKEQEDMAGPGDNTTQNNAYEDSNQDNDLTPGQTNDNLNSATSGETQSSTEDQTGENGTNQNQTGTNNNGTDNAGTGNGGTGNNGTGTVGNVIDDAGNGVGDVINDAGNAVKDVADDIGKGL